VTSHSKRGAGHETWATRFGTHPDIPDPRDREFTVPRGLPRRLPRQVSLIESAPPIYNQGKKLYSCSANAIAAAIWHLERRYWPDAESPSRMFLYYNERAREGLAGANAPVSLRAGYKSIAKQGICREAMWPYHDDEFAVKPPRNCYSAALDHRAIEYFRIRREMKMFHACLADGEPFAAGLSVMASFMTKAVTRSGHVPMPGPHDRHVGGHAVLVVGYDDGRQLFTFRNSWGRQWGAGGYGTLPYAYLLDERLSWDFWTVRREGRVGPRGPQRRG
jgi:C1A family cysteine protease